MEKKMPFVHRDISWLSFNYRVLQEAKDPTLPLFERIKFLAIYSNNLDEFFRVRVAGHRNMMRAGTKTIKEIEYSPKEVLKSIQKIVNTQQEEYSQIFERQIIPELKSHGIYLLRRMDLNEEQREFLEIYFRDHLLPFVQPVLLVKNKIRPFLNNGALYLTLWLKDKNEPDGKDKFAIVKIPSDHLPRFIKLPSAANRHDLIILDDLVRNSVEWMFPGYNIVDTYSIKLTRDADLYIDDEFEGDLLSKIKTSLQRRHVGPASRFIIDREMPKQLLDFMMESFDLSKYDLFVEGRYHNNSDFFGFPSFGKKHLENPPLPPLPYDPLEKADRFFKAIRDRDHMIHVPYHSYESVVRFFEEAASDPNVTHIKIVQYRVAKVSRIMDALVKAVNSGKQVSAFIEVKARFDEEANLAWGETLEKAGVNVNYSFPGLKVHAKIALIRRKEGDQYKIYSYLSTGNFHEVTAKIYSDLGFFTADPRLTSEVARVFSFLETVVEPEQAFEHLLVGQFNLRSAFVEMVDQEIANQKKGLPAHITLKMNSLQDTEMIEKLYEASNAGVKVDLVVRGICCLVPGVPGFSENIHIISIVDRYLEHARTFIFHNNGDPRIYLSSADWMVRNLSHRVETAFPLYDEAIKKDVLEYMRIQLNDNVKARLIDEDNSNIYYRNTNDLAVRSQLDTYYYIKRKEGN